MFNFLKNLFLKATPKRQSLVDQIIQAIQGRAYDALHVLLDDPEVTSVIDHPNAQGVTPMVVAIREGDARLVRKMIRAGADVNARVTQVGSTTVLDLAVVESNSQVVRTLLHHGADITRVHTPVLYTAIDRADPRMVRALLEYQYDPYQMYGGRSPLDHAIHRSLQHPVHAPQCEVTRLLMEAQRKFQDQQRQKQRKGSGRPRHHHRRRRR